MASIREQLFTQMRAEVRAMASHALGTGLTVPAWTLAILARTHAGGAPPAEGASAGAAKDMPLRELARAHAEISKVVSPATPELMVLLYKDVDATRLRQTFGQARIVRSFMVAALLSLVVFLVMSWSPYLNDPKHGYFFTSSGWPLLLNEFFFLSSAAVGASFSNLFQIDRELSAGTFVPKNQSTYWVQFIPGIVGGLLLSTILNVQSIAPSSAEAAGRMHFKTATLALMGGFSSSVVQRMIEALESILRGSAEQEVQARDQSDKQRLEDRLAKDRMRATLMLVDMQRRLAGSESPEALRALVDKASRSLLSNEGESPPEAARPAAPTPPPLEP
jgi:hypothetical protein